VQRPGLNTVPAIAPDGTIYTLSRAHFNDRYAYLVAVHPDLTPAWSASLRGILNDGCGVLIPIDDSGAGCPVGTHVGVDPLTNDRPAGRVVDLGTSSPVVLPDGAILVGTASFYNYGRGHLFEFSSTGQALATYDFGWDITPAVFAHGGTYSILIKDNHYDGPPGPSGRYEVTSLGPDLEREWSFPSTQTLDCARDSSGAMACADDGMHPDGFEWCVNQPAVDASGVTFAGSEDGFLYTIDDSGAQRRALFLDTALGAAYTPVSIAPDGTVYVQNNGILFAVGVGPFAPSPRASPARPSESGASTRTVPR
jgi:outer membrane protein assembly factor BamB